MADARQRERAEQFKRLHDRSKILILPNVWDVVSARAFEELGFPALATSSAGVAAVLGYGDGQLISRGEMVEMARRIAAALSIPLTADMESGYGAVAETVREILGAGVVGVNLEDGRPDEKAIVPTSEQVERIREARKTANQVGVPLFINARVDVYLAGVGEPRERLPMALERGRAYVAAGADGVFVPGVVDRDTIAELARGIPAPLNVLAGPRSPTPEELAALGVARVSLGSGMHRATLSHARKLAQSLLAGGGFEFLEGNISHAEVNQLLRARPAH